MQNDSLIRPIEKWLLGAKKEDLTDSANRHVFGYTERKSTLLGVSWGRIEGTKK